MEVYQWIILGAVGLVMQILAILSSACLVLYCIYIGSVVREYKAWLDRGMGFRYGCLGYAFLHPMVKIAGFFGRARGMRMERLRNYRDDDNINDGLVVNNENVVNDAGLPGDHGDQDGREFLLSETLNNSARTIRDLTDNVLFELRNVRALEQHVRHMGHIPTMVHAEEV